MKHSLILPAAASWLLLAACHSSKPAGAPDATNSSDNPGETELVEVAPANVGLHGTSVSQMPKARIFKVHGCRPDVNVAITLSPDGRQVMSYPAPSDISAPMALPLADGFWLDLRGIGPESRYTTFSIEEYKALGDSLTPEFLLTHLADAAWPTEIVALPFDAVAPEAVERADALIGEGLPGCTIIYSRPFGSPARGAKR